MIKLMRVAKGESGEWIYYWKREVSREVVSPKFASKDDAVEWFRVYWDKAEDKPRNGSSRKWQGINRRKHLNDRRNGIDRRTELRFELKPSDRRKTVGRRSEDADNWGEKFRIRPAE